MNKLPLGSSAPKSVIQPWTGNIYVFWLRTRVFEIVLVILKINPIEELAEAVGWLGECKG